MDEWLQYVIPLVVIVFYVVAHIAGALQEQARQQEGKQAVEPAPSAPGEADRAGEERRLELDRRIEEARRRRAEETWEPKRSVESMPYTEEAPKPVVLAEPPRYASARLELPKPVPLPAMKRPATPAAPPAEEAAALAVAVVAARPVSAAARQVVEMLRRRNALAAAFLLKEVLDPPVSRRPRRV